ncbi:MAG: hypothetical protein HYZ44_04160 [Bacteroidetes bacterium]|nr:hypothetical protein [Bacteroidota bacterium]
MKNMAIGCLLIISIFLAQYFISVNVDEGQATDSNASILIFVAPLLIIGALLFVPFAQIIESKDGELTMFYQLGALRLRQRKLGKVREILLEQNELRYYCIRIRMSTDEVLEIEQHPTLDFATIRLDEFKYLLEAAEPNK